MRKHTVSKVIISFLLVTVMVVSVIGCSSNESSSIAANRVPASNAQSIQNQLQVGSGKVVEIEYWHINSETFGGLTTTELVDEFNRNNPGIRVTEMFIPNSYQGMTQDLLSRVAINKTPDVIQMGWSYLEYFSSNFAYTTPQNLIAEVGGNASFIEDTYPEQIKNLAVNVDGVLAGFPYGLSVPVLFVNDTILDEAGIDKNTLTTWPKVKEAAKIIQDKTGKWGFCKAEYSYTWELQCIIESNGGRYIADGKSGIDSPESVEAYTLIADMVLKDKSAIRMAGTDGRAAFASGEIGMYYDSVSMTTFILNNAVEPVTVLKTPLWENKQPRIPCGGNM